MEPGERMVFEIDFNELNKPRNMEMRCQERRDI
jgi:hypothetical protein